MHPYCAYSTINPIYLTLFPSPFTNRAIPFLFFNINFFFWKMLVLLLCIYWPFWSQFCFYLLRFNLVFLSFGFLFLLLQQFSFISGLVMISDFSPCWFARLTNLGTFKVLSKETLFCSNKLLNSSGDVITFM